MSERVDEVEIPKEILAFRFPIGRCPSLETDGPVYCPGYDDGSEMRFIWKQRLDQAEAWDDPSLISEARRVLSFVAGPGTYAQYIFEKTMCSLLHNKDDKSVLLLREPNE